MPTKLLTTTTRPLHHMHIQWSCVCFYFLVSESESCQNFYLVLNSDIKMSYFEKNWDPELQKGVLEAAEEIVHLLFCL